MTARTPPRDDVLGDADLLALSVFPFLLTPELVRLAGRVSRWFRAVARTDAVWEPRCAARWATKAHRYHLTPDRKAHLVQAKVPWVEHYVSAEIDGRRTHFNSPDEVSALTFDFSFRGMPQQTASENFRFGRDGMISGHPNGISYRWWISRDGNSVHLGQFPIAKVARMHDWHWAIANGNVVWCSLDPADIADVTLAEVLSASPPVPAVKRRRTSCSETATSSAPPLEQAAAPAQSSSSVLGAVQREGRDFAACLRERAAYTQTDGSDFAARLRMPLNDLEEMSRLAGRSAASARGAPGRFVRRKPRNAVALYPEVFKMAEFQGCTAVSMGDSIVMLTLPQWHQLLQNVQQRGAVDVAAAAEEEEEDYEEDYVEDY
jgi:hypothetical protein